MERKLSERVAIELLEMITLKKRFTPGDKLPGENELCVELGVSRTTLRAAIQSLVNQNILETKRGKGTFVKERVGIRNSEIFDRTSYSGMRLKDLYEVRLIFEPYSAYYAALRATDEEMARIEEYEKIIEEKLNIGEDCVEINRLFHNAIAMSTHNEFMHHFISTVSDEIVRMFQEMEIKQEMYENTLNDHKLLMEYLLARDPEGARLAMKLHLTHAVQDYGSKEMKDL